jgi:hypothetical protein
MNWHVMYIDITNPSVCMNKDIKERVFKNGTAYFVLVTFSLYFFYCAVLYILGEKLTYDPAAQTIQKKF